MTNTTALNSPPELLAPAGDWDAMHAAVANGADAVYFGLSAFNARHRATNFTLEELPRVMKYLHDHNVRGYVAFNTLIFSDELEDAARFIAASADAGVDALIVQDLGIARLIQHLAPTLPVHGSTQMTLTEPRGIEFVRRLGVSRVILARELSAGEIERIAVSTAVPVEVFIHGALCVSYSGQCLTSEAIGGRSANRGQCAQACRLPYDLIVDGQPRDLADKAYLLSPQDLAAYDLIDDLLKIGVCSFKIEGRLKSAHYVAATTQTYRAALDAALSNLKFKISNQQYNNLAQSFSRGFTHGFLDGVNHQELVHARFPKSRGLRVGTVTSKTSNGIVVDARPDALKPGDGIVFDEGHPEQDEQGGRIAQVLPFSNSKTAIRNPKSPIRNSVELRFHAGDINLSAVSIGAIVWKTDDPAIRKRLEQSFSRETVARRVPLDFRVEALIGQPLHITARDAEGHESSAVSAEPLQRADKYPLTVGLLREQLGRLGQTPFELGDIELLAADPVMVPKSLLNDLRRQLVERILTQRQSQHTLRMSALDDLRSGIDRTSENADSEFPKLTVLTRTMDQLRAALDWTGPDSLRPSTIYCDFEDIRKYKDAVPLARRAAIPIALATLRIVKPHEDGLLKQILDAQPDYALVRNLAALSFYSEHHLPMLGDYSLNIANELTAQIFHEAGVHRMVPSYDLNWKQLEAMLHRFSPSRFESVIHQHIPMFHMEHCVFAHTLSSGTSYKDCGRPCEIHQVDLRDRVGTLNPLIPDVGCRNTLFNAAAQSAAEYVPRMKQLGLRYFRVELLRETADQTRTLLDRYARVLLGIEDPRSTLRQLRVLNQLGVTRGTLEHA